MKARSPLDTRRRKISRIALYGTLVLDITIAGLLLDLASAPLLRAERVDWESGDWVARPEVVLLRDYIRIDTSAATGDVAAGARFLADVLEREGIEPHLETLGSGDANLWAVIEGDDPGAIVLHHHIDVSPALDAERWLHPPYEAYVDGPWLYGRGAFDMKSVGIAQLSAFLDLARSGVRPRRSVILLATSGEETGSDLGTLWVLARHPELVDRFRLLLTEGGVVEGRGGDDIKYWGTEFAQKRFATIIVCDPSAERLEGLRKDLVEFGASGPPERLVDEVAEFLPYYAPTRDREDLRQVLADPAIAFRSRPVFESLPGYVKAMFRTELRPVAVEETASGYELVVNVHMLPGTELEDIRDQVLGSWLFHGFTTQVVTEPSALHGSPIDDPALATIARLIHEREPDVPAGPMFLPWTATDARFFRAHGIPSYGFSPFLFLTTDVIRVDQTGERISLPDYVDGVALYTEVVHALVD